MTPPLPPSAADLAIPLCMVAVDFLETPCGPASLTLCEPGGIEVWYRVPPRCERDAVRRFRRRPAERFGQWYLRAWRRWFGKGGK